MSTKRQPKGIPVGGQFAANEHDEAPQELSSTIHPYAPGGSADTLSPRGFVPAGTVWAVEKALEEARAGDDEGYARAMEQLGVDDPDDPYFLEVSASYDDAATEEGTFPSGRFTEEVQSLSVAYRGWNEDTYPEPSFGARADEAKGKPVTEVNRMIRKEFKDAQDSGYLPKTVDIRVFKHNGEPRVEVSGIPEEFRHRDFFVGECPHNTPERMRETPQFKELDRRIKAVAHTFAVDKTNRNSHDPVFLTWNMPIVTYQR